MKIEEAMKLARASIEIENISIKPEHTELVRKRLNNQISEEEFQQQVKDMVSKSQ